MSKQYFYIPKKYEVDISNDVNSFLNGGGVFTIITGVYKEFLGIVDNSNSLVFSKLITGAIIYIKKNYENIFDNKKYEIIGFCMEGDFQLYAPAYYNKILSLPDCYIFNSANEYLEFINNL